MITFSSLNPKIFDVNALEFKEAEKERVDIVTAGRLLMSESQGKGYSSLMTAQGRPVTDFTARLTADQYAETNRNTRDKTLLYAAKRACAISGEIAPATFEDFSVNRNKFLSDETFLKVLAGIIRDVVTPLLPLTMSNALGYLVETVGVNPGETYELDIESNDIFVFEDSSTGAARSKPSNYLYSKSLTLNPRARTAKATIKWKQLLDNNADIGRFYNSIAAGMVSKINALSMAAMRAASNDVTKIPAALKYTNTSINWINAGSKVTALNGDAFTSRFAIGHPAALTKALPSGAVNLSNQNLDAALATMLGVEWAKYGYLGDYMGASLLPLTDSIVPGTQNTSMLSLVPQDKIWIMAASGTKPIYMAVENGTPVTIELDPTTTADSTVDIIVTMYIDVRGVFASKMAEITV